MRTAAHVWKALQQVQDHTISSHESGIAATAAPIVSAARRLAFVFWQNSGFNLRVGMNVWYIIANPCFVQDICSIKLFMVVVVCKEC